MAVSDDKQKIGSYLNSLIRKSEYPNVRQFCKAYLIESGTEDPTDEEIGNMQNRISQITGGKKGIQIYDLLIFCKLLNVSCEQILSGGKCFVPRMDRPTNYQVAHARDEKIWKEYLDREDAPFLNPDEYNKTVIDYALEFKNYGFLKYLCDNGHIWFVDKSRGKSIDRSTGFGAGTDIRRRDIGEQDRLICRMFENQEELRQKMIALAVENRDFDMLTELLAREVPEYYALSTDRWVPSDCLNYCNEDILREIEASDSKMLEYFSEEFWISDQFENKHLFIYPYMPQLLARMIAKKNKYAEPLLRRCIEHNQRVYGKLSEMLAEAFERADELFNCWNYDKHLPKVPVEDVVKASKEGFNFYDDSGLLSYFYIVGKKSNPYFAANVIRVDASSDDLLISSLIEQLNRSYEAVRTIRPDTSGY